MNRLFAFRCRAGFTTLELLLALTLGLIVVSGAYGLMLVTSRAYGGQRETLQARMSLRATGSIFLSELAGASASGGDLYTVDADSLVIRSITGSGVVCADDASGNKLGLQEVSGAFAATSDDSVLVYRPSSEDYGIQSVQQAWTTPAAAQAQIPVCFWGDSSTNVPRPQVALMVPSGSGVVVGSLLYGFRRTTYALFQSEGKWWLGRRVGGGTEELLVGPMLAPGDGGLTLTYYDAAGNPTTDPLQVQNVRITLRSKGFAARPTLSGGVGPDAIDSLTVRAFMRNSE